MWIKRGKNIRFTNENGDPSFSSNPDVHLDQFVPAVGFQSGLGPPGHQSQDQSVSYLLLGVILGALGFIIAAPCWSRKAW